MSEAAASLREPLLRQILAADPDPWYAKEYALAAGADRETLYAPLNDLRVANLVQLTDWVHGRGQGYLITPMEFLNRGDIRTLHELGAVGAPDIAKGEWWRLLTTCFLHFGLMHITLNMTSLFLQRWVEIAWGSGRLLVLYLICGVCGSCAAVFYNPGEVGHEVYLAGASGALWGIMTSAIVWLVLHRQHLPGQQVRLRLNQMFFTLALNVGVSMLPNVSAAAHFGGATAGILAAFLLRIHKSGTASQRSMAAVLLAGLPALFLLSLGEAMEHDQRLEPFLVEEYRKQIDPTIDGLPARLDELEPRAERLYIQPGSQRNSAEAAKVKDELEAIVKQTNEAKDWVKNSKPVDAAKPLRERGIRLCDALTAYADGLAKETGGEPVRNLNELRRGWQDARSAWQKLAPK